MAAAVTAAVAGMVSVVGMLVLVAAMLGASAVAAVFPVGFVLLQA